MKRICPYVEKPNTFLRAEIQSVGVGVACGVTESNLIVEIVASVDMYCKIINNAERYRTEKRGSGILRH